MREFVDIGGGAIEYELHRGDPRRTPLVFLHEGLGSIDLWRGVPERIAEAVGEPTVLVFARHGHGASSPAVLPRPVTYMHHEADAVLPALLMRLELAVPVLIGHSDGASIALLFAGAGGATTGVVCLAPHVFVEPESIAGIEAARQAFESTDMVERMARYHRDPVATFRGWNDVWLSAAFQDWNITDRLPGIGVPLLLIQGTDDDYGTFAQLDAIHAAVDGPVDQLRVDGAGHSPHLDRRDVVVPAIVDWLERHAR